MKSPRWSGSALLAALLVLAMFSCAAWAQQTLPSPSELSTSDVSSPDAKGAFSFTFSWKPATFRDPKDGTSKEYHHYVYQVIGCNKFDPPGCPAYLGNCVTGPAYQVKAVVCSCGYPISVAVFTIDDCRQNTLTKTCPYKFWSQPIKTPVPPQPCSKR